MDLAHKPMTAILERYFQLQERGSTVTRELRGAVATYLTMAYILFANPAILKAAGVPFEPAVACTALAAGVCCIAMGLASNFPMALASGMGLNAVVAFQVAKAAGSWQTAMGLIVLDGVFVLLLVLTGLREAVLEAIPVDLRRAIGAGIGLFIAFIGLVNGGIVAWSGVASAPLTHGSLRDPATAIAAVGLIITAALFARKVPGSLVVGILVTTAIALACGVSHLPGALHPPRFDILFQADVRGALTWQLMPLLFAVMMVDFFDTLGTATAIAEQGGLVDRTGRIRGLRSLLVVDSISAATGGLCGVSSVTCYIESAAGVADGARTGLCSVFVGLFFLLSILLAPIAGMVPAAATAPALILVGFLMMSQIASIDFGRYETAIPAFVTMIGVPLTYSIAHGVGMGFVTYVAIQLLAGKRASVHPMLYVLSLLFVAYFIWGKA
jgi:AGZA family xanthine/uracil permease-like MFS transporter